MCLLLVKALPASAQMEILHFIFKEEQFDYESNREPSKRRYLQNNGYQKAQILGNGCGYLKREGPIPFFRPTPQTRPQGVSGCSTQRSYLVQRMMVGT